MYDRLRSNLQRLAVIRVLGLVWIITALIGAFPAAVAANPYDAREALERYASGTWASFVAMTDKKTGKWVNNQYKGVEKIYLTYDNLENDILDIYVLSYERITPIWMAQVKLPRSIRETIRIKRQLYSY